MIRSYSFRQNKMSVSKRDISKKAVLIDCLNPSKKELQELTKTFKIAQSDMEIAVDNEARPRLLDYENYSMIIFSSARLERKRVFTFSFALFIHDKTLIIIRHDEIPSLTHLMEMPKEKIVEAISKGPAHITYLLIDFAFDNYFKIMDDVEDEISKLETRVFKNADESTVKRIFKVKKDLIYVYKALVADREVIGGIQKEYLTHITKKEIKLFQYVYNDAIELVDIVSTYKDLLTSTLEIYMSSVSNKMNDVMKKMTVVASFVLIPTLISGIYGMNFKFMPEIEWPFGYGFAIGLMILSIILMYAYFVQKEYL